MNTARGYVQPRPIEFVIPNVSLNAKIDACAAVIAAIREAHRDEMSDKCWKLLNAAQDILAEANLGAYKQGRLTGSQAPVIEG